MKAHDVAAAALALHFPEEIGEAGLRVQADLKVIEAVTTGAAISGEDHAVVIAGLTALVTDMAFALSRSGGYPADAREVLNRFSGEGAHRTHYKAISA